MDFCSYVGQQFLIVVDCFTDWPEIISMQHDTSTSCLIQALTQLFCQTAVPNALMSHGLMVGCNSCLSFSMTSPSSGGLCIRPHPRTTCKVMRR